MNIEINEERQPPWEQITEREKGETSSNVRQVLGRLHKKAEEEREQEERHALDVREKIKEGRHQPGKAKKVSTGKPRGRHNGNARDTSRSARVWSWG